MISWLYQEKLNSSPSLLGHIADCTVKWRDNFLPFVKILRYEDEAIGGRAGSKKKSCSDACTHKKHPGKTHRSVGYVGQHAVKPLKRWLISWVPWNDGCPQGMQVQCSELETSMSLCWFYEWCFAAGCIHKRGLCSKSWYAQGHFAPVKLFWWPPFSPENDGSPDIWRWQRLTTLNLLQHWELLNSL